MQQTNLNDKRVINGWAFFDWANSAYFLVISTAIFPIYYTEVTPDMVYVFGQGIPDSALYSYAVSFAYVVIAILSPLLSGIADYGGRRMFFLKCFTTLGALGCLSLFFFTGDSAVWLGTSAFVISTIGAAGGIVFYNAYLPEIATEDMFDKVSARGYAFGYIGSVLLLVFCLFMIERPHLFGMEESTLPVRIAFALVGIWWFGFAQITFNRLPKDKPVHKAHQFLQKGMRELKTVWNDVRYAPDIKWFLAAFFFFSAGVQTVIYLASVFASKELQFEAGELILTILILQIVAIFGAYLFAWISKLIGNIRALMVQILIWIIICGWAYLVVGKIQFFILAGLVGLVLGGIQSLSRSTYSKLLEDRKEDLTSYFSFYDVLYKVSIVAGAFLFGFTEQLTGGMRNSVLTLTILFVIGLVLLMRVRLHPTSEKVR